MPRIRSAATIRKFKKTMAARRKNGVKRSSKLSTLATYYLLKDGELTQCHPREITLVVID